MSTGMSSSSTELLLIHNCKSVKGDADKKHLRKVTADELVALYAGDTPRTTFLDWVKWGKRLLFLAAAGAYFGRSERHIPQQEAGTLNILPIIAALDMRTHFTRKTTTEADILCLATALREVKRMCRVPSSLLGPF